MKYTICIVNLLFLLSIYVTANLGGAVFRGHAISITTEIQGLIAAKDVDRHKLQEIVLRTGNTRFYYAFMSQLAGLGCLANTIIIIAWLVQSRKRDNAIPASRSLQG